MAQIFHGFEKEELWKLLVETAHALPMYKNHKRYVGDVLLNETPEISPQVLSVQLNIPLGEAMVLLEEIRDEKPAKGLAATASTSKGADRSLLDFREKTTGS